MNHNIIPLLIISILFLLGGFIIIKKFRHEKFKDDEIELPPYTNNRIENHDEIY